MFGTVFRSWQWGNLLRHGRLGLLDEERDAGGLGRVEIRCGHLPLPGTFVVRDGQVNGRVSIGRDGTAVEPGRGLAVRVGYADLQGVGSAGARDARLDDDETNVGVICRSDHG